MGSSPRPHLPLRTSPLLSTQPAQLLSCTMLMGLVFKLVMTIYPTESSKGQQINEQQYSTRES